MKKGKRRIFLFSSIHKDRSKNIYDNNLQSMPEPTFTTNQPANKVQIYASELERLAMYIQDYPNIETGGQLFGSWTASGAPRIMYVIGPGDNANHQQAFFNQDIDYLRRVGAELKTFGLQHIGEWHSHHRLGLPCPSSHDAHTIQNSIESLDLNRLCLCIGSIDDNGKIRINPYNFSKGTRYTEASWEVINTENRLGALIDVQLNELLKRPDSSSFHFAEAYLPERRPNHNSVGWFSNIENRLEFKKIIDDLKHLSHIVEVIPQISNDGLVRLSIGTQTYTDILDFPADFPNRPFSVTRKDKSKQWPKKIPLIHWITYSNMSVYEIFMSNYNTISNIYG